MRHNCRGFVWSGSFDGSDVSKGRKAGGIMSSILSLWNYVKYFENYVKYFINPLISGVFGVCGIMSSIFYLLADR